MSEYKKQLMIDLMNEPDNTFKEKHYKEYLETLKIFRRSKLMKIHQLEYELGLSNQDLKQTIEKLSLKRSQKSGNLWCWITISPDPKKFKSPLDVTEFVNYVIKKCNRSIIEDWKMCIEQRTTSLSKFDTLYPSQIGLHIHILARRNLSYKPSKFCKNFRNSWKPWVKNVSSDKFVKMIFCPEEYLQDKLDYMNAQKTGEGKSQKCIVDSYMRKKHGMLSMYSKHLEI